MNQVSRRSEHFHLSSDRTVLVNQFRLRTAHVKHQYNSDNLWSGEAIGDKCSASASELITHQIYLITQFQIHIETNAIETGHDVHSIHFVLPVLTFFLKQIYYFIIRLVWSTCIIVQSKHICLHCSLIGLHLFTSINLIIPLVFTMAANHKTALLCLSYSAEESSMLFCYVIPPQLIGLVCI